MTGKNAFKILIGASVLLSGFLIINQSMAEQGVAGTVCGKNGGGNIAQCDDNDSFTTYSCQHPDWETCNANKIKSGAKSKECSKKYGYAGEFAKCLIPLADPFYISSADPDANNINDAETFQRLDEMENDCKSAAAQGKRADPCCAQIEGARACSKEIIVAREAFEACLPLDYVYKPLSANIRCDSCVTGKILKSGEDACYTDGDSNQVIKNNQNDEELDAIARKEAFVKSFLKKRPRPPEDMPLEESGILPGSDTQYLTGTPYGPFISDERSNLKFEYRVATGENTGNGKIVLPDGVELDPGFVPLGTETGTPVGTRIFTPADSNFVFFFRVATGLKNTPGPGRGGRIIRVELQENSEVVVEEIYNGFARLRVTKGFVRFTATGPRSLVPASETGVMLGTKGTDYGMFYNPETKKTFVEIYDGEIEIIDEASGQILSSIAATYESDIKQAEITAAKNIAIKTALPQSEWDASTAEKQSVEKSDSGWSWWLAVIFLLGIAGYLYHEGYFVSKKS